MLQLRSRLNVADNSGAKEAWAIGVLGIRKDNASVGDIIKAHVREAAPDGNVKKGKSSTPWWFGPRRRSAVRTAPCCGLIRTPS